MAQARSKTKKDDKKTAETVFLSEQGNCPVDGAALEFVVFDESSVGLGLLSESFPYMTRICPHCLSASNDKDFFDQSAAPYSESPSGEAQAIRQERIHLLPARLAVVKQALSKLAPEALELLIEDRREALEASLQTLIARAVPNPSDDTVATLVQHGLNLLLKNAGLDDLVDKLVQHSGFASRIAQDSVLNTLLCQGADPSQAAQAGVYGVLLSVFDERGLARLAEPPIMRQETALAMSLLHQNLVCMTVYSRQLSINPAAKKQVKAPLSEADPARVAEIVEECLQAAVTKHAQQGYDCLYLGMSYYRSAMTEWCLLNMQESSAEQRVKELSPIIWKAIIFLELTVLSENYPQFTRSDKIQAINIKGRIKVPFVYAEFGVRHILCFLYNELGKMRKEAGVEPDMDVLDLPAEIKAHWLAVHERFCQIEFGGPKDPKAVQTLVPRLIAFATTCFHKDTADLLKQTVLDNRGRLYGRYMAEGLALASSMF